MRDCPVCDGKGIAGQSQWCTWCGEPRGGDMCRNTEGHIFERFDCAACKGTGSAWAGTDAEVFTADCIAIEMLTRLCGLPEIIDDRDLVAAWDDSDGFEPSPCGERKEPSEWHAMLSREMHHRMHAGEIDVHLEALERERNAPTGRNEPDGSEYAEAEG
jgi:hypothetical protein